MATAQFLTIVFLQVYNKDKQKDLTAEQKKHCAVIAEATRQEILHP